tara:strand:- start:7818 stop:7973 length:156 start_codon:yes stop_codon:yes gene_type:complete
MDKIRELFNVLDSKNNLVKEKLNKKSTIKVNKGLFNKILANLSLFFIFPVT